MDDIRRGVTNHKNLEVTSHALLLFGNGDGGGGPTPPMLEKLRRVRALGKRHDAGGQIPLVKSGGSFEEFYEAVREETDNGRLLPIWRGELYLEIHRATYTSHGSIKRNNRKLEILMREAEYATAMASLHDSSYKYPKKELDSAWEDLLCCQFHDVLPGSAIHMVYDDAERMYAGIWKSIGKVLKDAHDLLYKDTCALGPNAKIAGKPAVMAVNTLPGSARQEVVKVPLADHTCVRAHSAQISQDGKHGYVLLESGADAALATPKGLYADAGRVSAVQNGPNAFQIANDSVKIKIEDGRITSIHDVKLE